MECPISICKWWPSHHINTVFYCMSREGCLYYSQWALLLSGLYFSVLSGKLLPAQLHVRACGLSFLYFVVRDQIKCLPFGVSNLKHKTATWSDYKLQSTRMTDHTRAHVTERTITYLFQPPEPAASEGECNLDIDIDALMSSRRTRRTECVRDEVVEPIPLSVPVPTRSAQSRTTTPSIS